MKHAVWNWGLGLCLVGLLTPSATPQDSLGRDLAGHPYRPHDSVSGELKIVGSQSMSALLDHWAEGLKKHHPQLKIEIDCEGSETALPELKANQTVLAALSRTLDPTEIKNLSQATQMEILALPVSSLEMVLIVNKENPLKRLPLAQVRDLWLPPQGSTAEKKWGALGATGTLKDLPITLVARDNSSGSRESLKRSLSGKRESQLRSHQSLSSYREIIKTVAAEKGAMGYCPRHLVTGEVSALILENEESSSPHRLVQDTCLVLAREKGKPPAPAILEFVAYALSQSGQSAVARDGFLPLERHEILAGLDRLGFSPAK